MPVAILMTPVIQAISLLCSVDPVYARKKHIDDRVGTLPIRIRPQNVIIFPKYTPSHAKSIGDWRCKRCSSEQMVIRQESRICLFCGESYYYESEPILFAPAPVRHFNTNANKRISHFKNWLARLQGKERCNVSAADLEAIRKQISTYPDSMSERQQIKLAMKELGLQKYYNHIYYVMRQVFGYALVDLRKINEARLVAMFMRIQEPFARIQQERTNMLSYQFLIRKFCELLGYHVYEYIPLLKSRCNLQKQDYYWRCICDELGIPFYPSV